MADENGEKAETADEKEKAPPPAEDGPDLKAMAAALKKANKEAETTRLKLKQYEDRDKTELDKAAEKATDAEQRAAIAERSLLQYRVAAEKNLPAKLATRLTGDTEAEMAADADELLAELTPRNSVTPKVPAGPREGQPAGEDMNSLIRERMRR